MMDDEVVYLGINLLYQKGSKPRSHVLLNQDGKPYIALDDDEALAFARQLEPVKALVDALRAIAGGNEGSAIYAKAHGLRVLAVPSGTQRIIAQAALAAVEDNDG